MINALSIDVEPWYVAELIRRHRRNADSGNSNDRIVESATPVLELLSRYNVKATFAILGIVAERYPELVKDIFDQGHEIASHGYSHRMLRELSPGAFKEEIKKTSSLLASITGERPIGFRAPSVSLDNTTRWALPILQKHGFKWDSSVCPARIFLYGEPGAPRHIYRPSFKDITEIDNDGGIVEFPLTVIKFGVKFPVAGGFYFRASPLWVTRSVIRNVNRSRPANVYVHPWETDRATPRVRGMPLPYRLASYYGVNSMLGKLEAILKEFEFKPIRDVLGIA